MKKFSLLTLFSILVIASLLLVACGGGNTNEPAVNNTEAGAAQPETGSENTAPAEDTAAPSAEGPVEIRWFIGLGAGGNPEEIEKERAFVADFNAKYGDRYTLVLDVVQNETAYDVLKTQIASGNVPDIVGPVGVRGMYSFEGAWLDMTPMMTPKN